MRWHRSWGSPEWRHSAPRPWPAAPPTPPGPDPPEPGCPGPGRGVRRHLQGHRHRRHPRPDRLRPADPGQRHRHPGLRPGLAPAPPRRARPPPSSPGPSPTGAGIRLVIAIIPVLVVVQILADALHLGYLGSFIWPVFLAVASPSSSGATPARASGCGSTTTSCPCSTPAETHRRRALLVRIGTGVVIGAVGLLVFVLGSPEHGRAATGGRCPAGHRGHRGRLRPVVALPGPRPDVGAPGPGPGRGAGRDGGPRPRLGPPDPGPDPAVGRRSPARGAPGPGPGARAPVLAVRGPGPGHHRPGGVDAGRGDQRAPAPDRGRPRDHRPGGGGRGLRAGRRDAGPARRLAGGHGQRGQMVGRPPGLASTPRSTRARP